MTTDTQLKIALAKMLPGKCFVDVDGEIVWTDEGEPRLVGMVFDTELLHVCWLIESSLERGNDAGAECYRYAAELYRVVDQENQPCMATWQQRATALAKVKGVEV